MPIRILLVDDSVDFLLSAERVLATNSQIEVVGCATSGQEALNLVSQLHPDLVLMDLSMPGMSGIEAARRMKSQSYWRDVGTLDAYYEANMDLLGEQPQFNLDHLRRIFPIVGVTIPGGNGRAGTGFRPKGCSRSPDYNFVGKDTRRASRMRR